MNDQPYTEDDLRAEAARQHAALTAHSNSRTVLGRMLDARIPSTCTEDGSDGLTWDEALNCDALDEPKRAIHDLITRAADLSEWAVNIGADGLKPSDQRLDVGVDSRVRVHFAFAPDMSEADRRDFVSMIAAATVITGG